MTPEEQLLLSVFRDIREKGHGEMNVVIRDGKIVKIDKVEKIDLRLKD
jgi:hypothetical protein